MPGAPPPPPRDTDFGDAHFLEPAELDQFVERKIFGPAGIPIGSDESGRLRFYCGEPHLVTIAPSRTGKGTTAIVPTLLEHDASMLVIDPKGQNAAVTARRRRELHGHTDIIDPRVFVVNPFGLHTGDPWKLPQNKFNPLAAMNPDDDNFVADVSSLCEALIITEGHEPHWSNAARDLISAIIMDMMLREPDKATLPRMRKKLTAPRETLVSNIKKNITECADDAITSRPAFPAIRHRAARFAVDSREVQTVLSTAITQTSFLDDPMIAESLSGDDFRLLDLKQKGMTVFLVLPSRYLAAYFRWLRLFVVAAVDALTSTAGKPSKPVLLVLDEFASLGHLTAIETAMALAAGYGVQLWPILQDINQVKTIYSDRWETFLANAGIVQVFRPNDLTTAKYFSERAGNYTHRLSNLSHDVERADYMIGGGPAATKRGTRQYSLTERPLRSPHELFGMADNRQILFISGSEFPAWLVRTPYYDNERYKPPPLYDDDPYHL